MPVERKKGLVKKKKTKREKKKKEFRWRVVMGCGEGMCQGVLKYFSNLPSHCYWPLIYLIQY